MDPGVSGLTLIPETQMLHQTHQPRMVDSPGNRYVNFFTFDAPNWNRINRVKFNALSMVVEDVWVEFEVTRLAQETDSAAFATYLPPPASWIGDNGVQLMYKDQEVYKMTEIECRFSDKIYEDNYLRQIMKNEASDETDNVTLLNLWKGAAWDDPITRKVFMHCRVIADKIESHKGAEGAYASNAWSLDVSLRNVLALITGGASAVVSTSTFTIDKMTCYFIGHAEDSANMLRVSKALALDGVKLVMDAPYNDKIDLSATSTTVPYTLAFPSMEGELTQIWLVPRYSAGLDSVTATTVNRSGWMSKVDAQKLRISIGTKTQPQALWGQILDYDTAKLLVNGYGYEGGNYIFNRRMDSGAVFAPAAVQDGTTPFEVTTYPTPVDQFTQTNALFIPLAEKAGMGQRFGTYSGAVRIKHDFQIQIYVDSNLSAAVRFDVVLFVRRVIVLGHESIKIVNEV
jgi:hypothetical protein